jgi:hypothetical protein
LIGTKGSRAGARNLWTARANGSFPVPLFAPQQYRNACRRDLLDVAQDPQHLWAARHNTVDLRYRGRLEEPAFFGFQ